MSLTMNGPAPETDEISGVGDLLNFEGFIVLSKGKQWGTCCGFCRLFSYPMCRRYTTEFTSLTAP